MGDGSTLLLSMVLLLQGRANTPLSPSKPDPLSPDRVRENIFWQSVRGAWRGFIKCPVGAAVPTNVRSATAGSGLNPLSLSLAVRVWREHNLPSRGCEDLSDQVIIFV